MPTAEPCGPTDPSAVCLEPLGLPSSTFEAIMQVELLGDIGEFEQPANGVGVPRVIGSLIRVVGRLRRNLGTLIMDEVCLLHQNRATRLTGRRGRSIVTPMTTSTPLPLGEVKAHLSELVSRVGGQHERVTVTVHGRPTAVLVAVDDLEALEETIAILSDPKAMEELTASEDELARGDLVAEEELARAMAYRRQAPR